MGLNVTTTTDGQGGVRHVFDLTGSEDGDRDGDVGGDRDGDSKITTLNVGDSASEELSSQRVATVVIRHTPDDAERMTCHCYNEDGNAIWQHAFERREMTFDPISILGRGESTRLLGTSPTEEYVGPGDVTERSEVPETVQTLFNALGMTIVPRGEWWLNG